MKESTKVILKAVLSAIIAACTAILTAIGLQSCNTTKATIVSTKDSAQTTITITTNNPQQVKTDTQVNATLNNK